MEEFRMTIRVAGTLRQWTVDGWTASICFAALSTQPESWEDWDAAWRRYFPNHDLLARGQVIEGIHAAADSGPWCLLDCAGRTIVTGGGFEPFENGTYSCVDDDPEDVPSAEVDYGPLGPLDSRTAWIEVPHDWLTIEAADGWHEVVSHRAAVAAESVRIDVRAVLYGPPLFQFLAEQVLKREEVASGSSEDEYRATKQIHAEWLLTSRSDLGGQAPREFILQHREAIQRDLEQRATQWSRQGFAPEGLPEDSAAFRFGGWGNSEVVLYFDLIRELLEQAWEWARAAPGQAANRVEQKFPGADLETATNVTSSQATTSKVQALASHLAASAKRWLASPEGENSTGLTPAQIVQCERRRIPATDEPPRFAHDVVTIPGQSPEGDGGQRPCFIWFDGHHLELEDEFAFSMTPCRDDWEDMQAHGYRI